MTGGWMALLTGLTGGYTHFKIFPYKSKTLNGSLWWVGGAFTPLPELVKKLATTTHLQT
jgi:hypothetical protein